MRKFFSIPRAGALCSHREPAMQFILLRMLVVAAGLATAAGYAAGECSCGLQKQDARFDFGGPRRMSSRDNVA
jgi:hypothetical protein